MSDEEMLEAVHDYDQELFEAYRQEALDGKRITGFERLNTETFKNRYQMSAKLTPTTYAALYAYAKAKGYSINRAIREILTIYFALQENA